jgi:hypothetical protein
MSNDNRVTRPSELLGNLQGNYLEDARNVAKKATTCWKESEVAFRVWGVVLLFMKIENTNAIA